MEPPLASYDPESVAVGVAFGTVFWLIAQFFYWGVIGARAARRRERADAVYRAAVEVATGIEEPRADRPAVRARIETAVRAAEAWLRERNPDARVNLRIGPEAGPYGPVVEVEVEDGGERAAARLDRHDLHSENTIRTQVLALWMGLVTERIGRPRVGVA